MSIMDTLPETNSSYLKMDGWNPFLLGFAQFSGGKLAVRFRECINPIVVVYIPIIPIPYHPCMVYLPTIFG